MAALLLLTAGGAVAGWWAASRLDPMADEPSHEVAADRGTLRYDPARDAPDQAWMELFARPEGVSLPEMNLSRQALDREPADLPPFPGDATHETRYRIAEGVWVDEVSFWRVRSDDPAASAEALARHYRSAAQDAGFGPPLAPETMRSQPGRTQLSFFDTDGAIRSLSIQIRENTRDCHVTIWLRYESATP